MSRLAADNWYLRTGCISASSEDGRQRRSHLNDHTNEPGNHLLILQSLKFHRKWLTYGTQHFTFHYLVRYVSFSASHIDPRTGHLPDGLGLKQAIVKWEANCVTTY